MKHKSLRQLARELGVSHSYLSQVKNGKRPASQKVVSKLGWSGKQETRKINQKHGGSVWESNPPETFLMPLNGFEVREAHRDSSAPLTRKVNHIP